MGTGKRFGVIATLFLVISGCSKSVEFGKGDTTNPSNAQQAPVEIPQTIIDRITALENLTVNQTTLINNLTINSQNQSELIEKLKIKISLVEQKNNEQDQVLQKLADAINKIWADEKDEEIKFKKIAEILAQHDSQFGVINQTLAWYKNWLTKLDIMIVKLEKYIGELNLGQFESRIVDLEHRTHYMNVATVDNRQAVVFDGVNVYIRNGMGSTSTQNGLGNLIIGYNENRSGNGGGHGGGHGGHCGHGGHGGHGDGGDDGDCDDDDQGDDDIMANLRTGSHYLVTGKENNYRGFAGIVSGSRNDVDGAFDTITGGYKNRVDGHNSSISGGRNVHLNGAYLWSAGHHSCGG